MVNAAGVTMPPIPMTQPIGTFLKGATDESISDDAFYQVAEEVGKKALNEQGSSRGKGKSEETGSTPHQHGFHERTAPIKMIALG
jgi:hypothetical protein